MSEYVNNLGGRTVQGEGESERASEFDVWAPKMTTTSMFGRHWKECLLHSLID